MLRINCAMYYTAFDERDINASLIGIFSITTMLIKTNHHKFIKETKKRNRSSCFCNKNEKTDMLKSNTPTIAYGMNSRQLMSKQNENNITNY